MRELELALSILVVILLGAVLVYASRRRRLLPATAGIIAALALGWGLAAQAVAVDYRDADGFVDCWPSCTAFQDGISATLFYGPVAAVLLLVTAIILYGYGRRRSGRPASRSSRVSCRPVSARANAPVSKPLARSARGARSRFPSLSRV
jgi:hypothetical protein